METLITCQLTDIASCSELASYNCGVDMRATIASSNFPPSSDLKSSTRFCKGLKLIKKKGERTVNKREILSIFKFIQTFKFPVD